MAKLITTDEEKATASFLDWDDASLGAMCKRTALMMQAGRKKIRERQTKDHENKDNLNEVISGADGMLLIANCIENDAESLTLKFESFSHKGEEFGDWEITVRQISEKK